MGVPNYTSVSAQIFWQILKQAQFCHETIPMVSWQNQLKLLKSALVNYFPNPEDVLRKNCPPDY